MTSPYRSCACNNRPLDTNEKSARQVSLRDVAKAFAVIAILTSFFLSLVTYGWVMKLVQMAHHRPETAGKPAALSGSTQEAPLPPPVPSFEARLEPFLPPMREGEPELWFSPSLLAPLVPETHEPDALLARVHTLRSAGVELFLLHIRVDRASLERGLPLLSTGRITPVILGGNARGIRFAGGPGASIASLIGLVTGDVVLSVNGYEMDSPERALVGYQAAKTRDRAVLEVLREGKRVVLDVSFR